MAPTINLFPCYRRCFLVEQMCKWLVLHFLKIMIQLASLAKSHFSEVQSGVWVTFQLSGHITKANTIFENSPPPPNAWCFLSFTMEHITQQPSIDLLFWEHLKPEIFIFTLVFLIRILLTNYRDFNTNKMNFFILNLPKIFVLVCYLSFLLSN